MERTPAGVSVAAALLPAIDVLLRRAGVGVAELAGFAIGIGPGSFTGLRIGVATLKGLAFGSDTPVAAISTLAALARAAGACEEPVVALLDARRGEVYGAAFRRLGRGGGRDAAGRRLDARAARGAPAGALPAGGRGRAARVRGAGARAGPRRDARARGRVRRRAGGRARRALPRAGRRHRSAAALVPSYLRRAEAEVRRTGERFEAVAADSESRPTGRLLTVPIPLHNLG